MNTRDCGLVCFLHGKESGPHGRKIEVLSRIAQSFNCRVYAPDFRGLTGAEQRVEKFLAELADQWRTGEDLFLVGSSMGGYVALRTSQSLAIKGMFLLAPAVSMPGYSVSEPPAVAESTSIVHGWQDSVVKPEKVMAFASKQRLELHLLDAGHDLLDALPQVEALFRDFLSRVLPHGVEN